MFMKTLKIITKNNNTSILFYQYIILNHCFVYFFSILLPVI